MPSLAGGDDRCSWNIFDTGVLIVVCDISVEIFNGCVYVQTFGCAASIEDLALATGLASTVVEAMR
jgi:hypothetical protein